MVLCNCGLMGGGKSILAVRDMLHCMANGGIVYTNILLFEKECLEYIREVYGKNIVWALSYRQFNSDSVDNVLKMVKEPPKNKPVTMVVIDECTEYFDTADRDTATARLIHKTWGTFLRQSRKVRIDTVLICQVFESINPKLRKLVQRKVITRDCAKFSLAFVNLGAMIPFLRNRFRQIYYDLETKQDVGAKFWKKDTRLYSCYDTKQIFGSGMVVSGIDTQTQVTEVKKAPFSLKLYTFVCFVLFFGAGWYFSSRGKGELLPGVPSTVVVTNYLNAGLPHYLVSTASMVRAVASAPSVVTNVYDVTVPRWTMAQGGEVQYMVFDDGSRWELDSWDNPYGKLYSIGKNVAWCVSYGVTNVNHYRLSFNSSVNSGM